MIINYYINHLLKKFHIGKYLINDKSFKNIQTIIIKSDREEIFYLHNSHHIFLLNNSIKLITISNF